MADDEFSCRSCRRGRCDQCDGGGCACTNCGGSDWEAPGFARGGVFPGGASMGDGIPEWLDTGFIVPRQMADLDGPVPSLAELMGDFTAAGLRTGLGWPTD